MKTILKIASKKNKATASTYLRGAAGRTAGSLAGAYVGHHLGSARAGMEVGGLVGDTVGTHSGISKNYKHLSKKQKRRLAAEGAISAHVGRHLGVLPGNAISSTGRYSTGMPTSLAGMNVGNIGARRIHMERVHEKNKKRKEEHRAQSKASSTTQN